MAERCCEEHDPPCVDITLAESVDVGDSYHCPNCTAVWVWNGTEWEEAEYA